VDRFVLAMKARNWAGAKGIGSGGCAIASTGDRRKVMRTTGKLFNIEALWYDRCVCLMGAE